MSYDIHTRAAELVRQSHGKFTHAQALAELGRRGAAARKRRSLGTLKGGRGGFENVERPLRLPYADN